MKPWLCVDARLIRCSGIGTYLTAVLSYLSQTDLFRFTFLHWHKDIDFLKQFNPQEMIEVKSGIYSPKEHLEIARKIPACDLFWTPHVNTPLLPLKAKKRLVNIYDTFHLTGMFKGSLLKKAYSKIAYQGACFFSDQIVTISNFSKEEILRYCKIKPEKIRVITLAASNHFKPKKDDKIYEKYHLPKRYLLTVSNGRPHKNLHRLADACTGLGIELVMVGGDRFVEDEDLPAVYSAAECFVFPSLYEGFGLPPVEAMACGCPVVVSNVASLPEACGESAEYVNPLDIRSIREGILKALQRKEELVEKGFEHIKKRTAIQYAEEHLSLIQDILKK